VGGGRASAEIVAAGKVAGLNRIQNERSSEHQRELTKESPDVCTKQPGSGGPPTVKGNALIGFTSILIYLRALHIDIFEREPRMHIPVVLVDD
jgi:hypothetical protein